MISNNESIAMKKIPVSTVIHVIHGSIFNLVIIIISVNKFFYVVNLLGWSLGLDSVLSMCKIAVSAHYFGYFLMTSEKVNMIIQM